MAPRRQLATHPALAANDCCYGQGSCNLFLVPAGDCPASAATVEITESFHGPDRIAVPSLSYRDTAGHVLRTQTYGFDGRPIIAEQRYDTLGRSFEADQPRFITDAAVLARRNIYDILGRVTTLSVFDEGGAQNSTTVYRGFETEMTNPKGQTRIEYTNALGQITKVRDSLGTFTQFSYDGFNNLLNTTPPNTINTSYITYDIRGRKTQLSDNAFGYMIRLLQAR